MNYQEIKNRIKGPVCSIVTPFKTNDDIDWEALERQINMIHNSGATMFYVMGYNSRFSELSWDEIKELNAFVTKKVKALDPTHIMIVADPLHKPTKVSAEFAQHAKEAGADVISILCREKYYSDDQIFAHFDYIAKASDIGILVHEMPFLSGYGGPPRNYTLPLLDRLADIPNVVALKEDAKDDAFSQQVIDMVSERASIIISGGGKRQWLRFADKGCQAWLNGIGVFDARLCVEFYKRYVAGDEQGYMDIINKIEVPFFERGVSKYGWHLTIKAAMQAVGLMDRYERLPLLALDDEKYQDVKAMIESLPIEEVLG